MTDSRVRTGKVQDEPKTSLLIVPNPSRYQWTDFCLIMNLMPSPLLRFPLSRGDLTSSRDYKCPLYMLMSPKPVSLELSSFWTLQHSYTRPLDLLSSKSVPSSVLAISINIINYPAKSGKNLKSHLVSSLPHPPCLIYQQVLSFQHLKYILNLPIPYSSISITILFLF